MKFWAFAVLVHAANIGASNLSRDWRISMQKEIAPEVVDSFVWIEKYSPPFILTKHLVFELVVISMYISLEFIKKSPCYIETSTVYLAHSSVVSLMCTIKYIKTPILLICCVEVYV